MSGLAYIKFRNKSEYFMTHMLNPTLVKLNMYDLSQFWMNSKWILLDRENIREFPELSSYCSIFFSWINIHEYFSFQAILYRDHILSCNGLLPFWVISTQYIFFRSFKKNNMEIFVWKKINISSILYHRWVEIEHMTRTKNYNIAIINFGQKMTTS